MPQPPFVSGDLVIDFAQHRVTSGAEEVLLTPLNIGSSAFWRGTPAKPLPRITCYLRYGDRNTAATPTSCR